jgi:uncharacterized protein (DUF983 family)
MSIARQVRGSEAMMDANASASTRRSNLIVAFLRGLCPRCRTGKIFRGIVAMNDPCPNCGLLFQREEGYFLGAMYVSYFLSMAVYLVLHVVWSLVRSDWFSYTTMLLAMASFLPFVPALFRYSRVLWIYLERDCCPTNLSAGSYEKLRLQQIESQHADESNPNTVVH